MSAVVLGSANMISIEPPEALMELLCSRLGLFTGTWPVQYS